MFQLNVSGRSLREFLTGGERKSRSHLERVPLFHVYVCMSGAAAQKLLVGVKVGSNVLILLLDIHYHY